ncbi:MAG: tRNA uridine(34) 5-carboxymethylaminomethyl modification radical SAM/GNAT enzyme Elp3 [Candidatus Iainarchaeum sp.]|jgi:elongator complex protein 3|nr:MAG: coproporphyrinogen III oxidase [archaeon ADurb.Bin336]
MLKKRKKEDFLFAKEIIKEIDSSKNLSEREFSKKLFFWAKHFGLDSIPSFPFILSCAKNPSKKVISLLSIKPTRSLSGVQVVAVMLPPFPCPGECIYCPSSLEDKKSPKSYTGFEPSTLRAQRLNYDAYQIVLNRINQLDATGNFANKIELIFQGSSFTALPKKQQESVVKKSLDAVCGKVSSSFSEAKLNSEKSKRRVVGITFETRPDLCSESQIKGMLDLGGTRVEIGVQNPSDAIYEKIKRGHTVEDVILSTKRLKDSSFKVLYHLMPGLPGSDYKSDLKNMKMVFKNPDFKPDMVKFYPCLVIKGTKLYDDWKKGLYSPLLEETAVKLFVELKSSLPKWVRVMRVERDIPGNVIEAGIKKTNLRQIIEERMKAEGKVCNCIRCREVGLSSRGKRFDFEKELSKAKLRTEFYDASSGEEAFISIESKNHLFGFLRLRNPSSPFLKQITPQTALVRELHVYGRGIPLGEREDSVSSQHQGLGTQLMNEAEKIAKERFGSNKVVVISGLGVREYYKKKFNYKKEEPFMSKKI